MAYLMNLTSASAGAAGSTAIDGARQATLTVNSVKRTVPGKTGPRTSKTTYRTAQVRVLTNDYAAYLAHEGKTAEEILVLGYEGGAAREITVDPVMPGGSEQVQIPGPETPGDVPVFALVYDVLEADDVTALIAAFTDGVAA